MQTNPRPEVARSLQGLSYPFWIFDSYGCVDLAGWTVVLQALALQGLLGHMSGSNSPHIWAVGNS